MKFHEIKQVNKDTISVESEDGIINVQVKNSTTMTNIILTMMLVLFVIINRVSVAQFITEVAKWTQ